MQNMGLVGMMTVDWPVTLDGIFSICKFFLLDIDSYGFSCIAGRGFHEVHTWDDDRWVWQLCSRPTSFWVLMWTFRRAYNHTLIMSWCFRKVGHPGVIWRPHIEVNSYSMIHDDTPWFFHDTLIFFWPKPTTASPTLGFTGQSEPIRYLLSALIFPVGLGWLFMCWGVSKLFPPRYRWSGSKVVSCMGAFLQVGFSTMSATSLAPMMCYKHPNGLRSILKYPGILCGSADHDLMLVIGWILLTVFVLGFLALCTFAVKMDARLLKFWAFSVSLNENTVKTVRSCFTSSRTFVEIMVTWGAKMECWKARPFGGCRALLGLPL